MKKLMVLLACYFFIADIIAEPLNGVALGVALSGDFGNFHYFSIDRDESFYIITRDEPSGAAGIGGIFSAKYVFAKKKWRVGAGAQYELGDLNSVKIAQQPASDPPVPIIETYIKTNNSYEFFIQPGYEIVDKTVLYITGGVIITKSAMRDQTESVPGTLLIYSQTQTGYKIGLGLETLLYKSLALSFEYSYSSYPGVNKEPMGNDGLTNIFKHNIDIYRAVFGVSYYFFGR